MIKNIAMALMVLLTGTAAFAGHTSDFNSLPTHGNYGTEYLVDVAYGYWGTRNADFARSKYESSNYGLLHVYLNQPILKDTYIKTEVCASWGLDKKSSTRNYDFNGGISSITYPNGDIYGSHTGGLPELALMQFVNDRKVCVIAGIVDFNNLFDAVAWSDNYFTGFANSAFMNSVMLPLVGGNLGGVIQADINDTDYVMFGVSRAGRDFCRGTNPLKSVEKDGFAVVAEYGFNFGESATVRLDPFVRHYDTKGHMKHENDYGIAGSIEYRPTDKTTLFVRAGASTHKRTAAYELSGGIRQFMFESREKDFFGAAVALINPTSKQDKDVNHRETVFEMMYNFAITDYMFVVPHVQYIMNPTYGNKESKTLWGVQTTLSF